MIQTKFDLINSNHKIVFLNFSIMSDEIEKTKIVIEPSPIDNDILMKKMSKEYDTVIRKLSFNEKPEEDVKPIKKVLPSLEKYIILFKEF